MASVCQLKAGHMNNKVQSEYFTGLYLPLPYYRKTVVKHAISETSLKIDKFTCSAQRIASVALLSYIDFQLFFP